MAKRKREDERGLEVPGDYQAYGVLEVGGKLKSVWIAWLDWDKTLVIASGFRSIAEAEAHAEASLRRSLNRRR